MRNHILLILSGIALLGANGAFAQKVKKDSIDIKATVKPTKNAILLQKVEITGSTASSYKSGYSFFGNKTQMAIIDIPQSISTITKELIHDKMEFTLKDV